MHAQKMIHKLGLLAIILLTFLLAAACSGTPEPEPPGEDSQLNEPPEVEDEPPPEPVSPYTGTPHFELLPRPLAVIIDNHRQARPQSGLQEAALVYEAIAEGEITRFLAVFPHYNSQDIGPIRSLRPYFATWAIENDAVFVHCGYSVHSKSLIDRFDNVDERPYPSYFWRSKARRAPHNVYTTVDRLLEAAERFNFTMQSDLPANAFAEPGESDTTQKVIIPFSSNNRIIYEFDRPTNSYLRFSGDQPHNDAVTERQISVTNIIIQYVPYKFISSVHREFELIGEGEGLYIAGGHSHAIRWRKEDLEHKTEFYRQDGAPLTFYPGNTWIHVLSPQQQAELHNGA